MMQTFGVFMIVKNEEIMLAEALESVKGADELVICDTGSTDKTIEIAKKYTDKVYTDYTWNDDFAEAKNHALAKCTCDWVMSLDADCRLRSSIEDIRRTIANAKYDTIIVHLYAGTNQHLLPKIFRRGPAHYFVGVNQEYLAGVTQSDPSDIRIEYLNSPTHVKDPNRNMRILQKAIANNPKLTREKFYLAREYYYHKQYAEAIKWLDNYLLHGTIYAEVVEAMYLKTQCLWYSMRGNEAREMCLRTIAKNPECKKALLLMSRMHYEPWKTQWRKIAEQATNANVIFT